MWAPFPRVASPLTPRLMLCLLGLSVLMPRAGAQTAQTLTWTSPTNEVLLLGQSYPLSAQSSSGLPVTFRVQNGPAVITGSTVTATNVGTVLLVAEQAGDAAHAPARLSQVHNQTGALVSQLGRWGLANGPTPSVQVAGNLAYVTQEGIGFAIFDTADPANPVQVGSYVGWIDRLQIQGRLAYAVAGLAGLQILDLGDPLKPVRLGGYDTAGNALAVEVQGHIAYVADYDAGLQILDVSDPAHPSRLGGYATAGFALSVQVLGNLAYVGGGTGGLQIIDVGDPANPRLVGSYPTEGQAVDVKVAGPLAYLADSNYGLRILDVSDPAAPRQIAGGFSADIRRIQVVGNLVWLAYFNGLQIIDVSDPARPSMAGGYTSNPDGRDFVVQGDLAYFVSYLNGLEVLKLRQGVNQTLAFDPPASVLVTNTPASVTIPLTATASSGLPVSFTLVEGPASLSGDRLTLTNLGPVRVRADQAGDFQFLPVRADRFIEGVRADQELTFDVPAEIILTNPVVTLSATASSGLPVTFTLLGGPALLEGNRLSGTNVGTVYLRAEQAGNAAYLPVSLDRAITFSSSGQTISWPEPTNAVLALGKPFPLTASASSGWPVSLQVVSGPALIVDRAIVATNVGRITVRAAQGVDAILERTFNEFHLPIQRVSSDFISDQANAVQVVGDLAYVADGNSGLKIFNVSDPAHPVPVGLFRPPSSAIAVQVEGSLAYLGLDPGGWQIVDVSAPAAPVKLSGSMAGYTVFQVLAKDGLAYVAGGRAGLQIFDVRDPALPLPVGSYKDWYYARSLRLVGSLLYVGFDNQGFVILDVKNPASPVLVGSSSLNGNIYGIQVVGNIAYVAAGQAGLQIFDVSDPANPVPLGNYQRGYETMGVQVRGPLAYLSAWVSGLDILDVSNPAQPLRVDHYSDPKAGVSYIQSLQVVGPFIFAADKSLGLQILQTTSVNRIQLSTPTPPGTELFLNPEILGPGPVTFQWYFGGSPLAGETNESMRLPEVNPATAGTYLLETAGAGYTNRSEPVTVYLPPPVLLQQPADLNVIVGRSNTLSVTAGGLPILRYQWRHEGAPLPGATNRILPLTVTSLSALGGYDVIVSNLYGVTTSRLAQVTLTADVAGFFPNLNTLASLPDGRILLGGTYTNAKGFLSTLVLRLLPDLSQDVTFQPADAGSSSAPVRLAAQPNGQVALLGAGYLLRFNPDGGADSGLVSLAGTIPPPGTPTDLVADGSGRLLVAGRFATGGQENRPLVRLLPDGSRDPVFAANLPFGQSGTSGRGVAQQRDGRLILVGSFSLPVGTAQQYGIARLYPDGTPDGTFVTGAGFDTGPSLVALDPQERVLVAGTFARFDGKTVSGLIRLNPNGTLDASFAPSVPGSYVVQIAALRTGEVVIRLFDGTVQLLSETGTLLDDYGKSATAFAVEPAGSILLGTGSPGHLVRRDAPTAVPPEIEFAWGAVTVSEADSLVQLPVRRTGPLGGSAQVAWHVRAGTAVAGVDFAEADGVIRFDPGVAQASLTFPLSAQNSTANDDRTLRVQLDSAVGASVPAGHADCLVTIEDDDVGLTAEIFASQSGAIFTPGTVVSTKTYYQRKLDQHRDAQVFFEWDGTGPRGTTNDYFSVIWTGWIVPEVSGQYRLATLADDGTRLWLDGRLVVSNWTATTFTTARSAPVQLEAGRPYRLVANYFEQTGQATCRLLWSLPGTSTLIPVPRRVLRPGSPEFTPPSLSGYYYQVTYATEAGRPVSLQWSTNGTGWKFLREAVSAVGGVTNSISLPVVDFFPNGALIRAVTPDGLAVTNAVPAQILAIGGLQVRTNITLVAGLTNAVQMWVPTSGDFGQSVTWLRDGQVVAHGPSLVVSGQDPTPAGTYQAVVTYPFAEVASDLRRIILVAPVPPLISTVGTLADGSFLISVAIDPAQPPLNVRIDVSADLLHWETVGTGFGSFGSFNFPLPPSPAPTQYIRAVVE